MLSHWIASYGYWAVFVGTVFEGETIVVLAGYAAHRGYLSPLGVALAAFAGSLTGDQVAFFLGRRFSVTIIARRPSWEWRVAHVRGWFERHATWLMVGFRFVYGIRNVAPFAIGSFGVTPKVFTPLNVLGAAVWAPFFTWLGYSFGLLISAAFARAHEYEEYTMGALALVGVVVATGLVFKRRARRT